MSINQDKSTLMIHEIHESIFNLPLENYTLTFDDGLYSQYYYYSRFKEIQTEKIYFISSNIVCSGQQSHEFPTCSDAHKKAFAGNYEDYMSIDQILELAEDPMVTIGGHGHQHTQLNTFNKITDVIRFIASDTANMLNWFKTNLKMTPTKFCYPYNEDYDGLYTAFLKRAGFTEFYGRERIPVETLLHT